MKYLMLLIVVLASAPAAQGQALRDLEKPTSPLVLAAQGSFFVGGETVTRTHAELGSFGPAGNVSVGQMYVRYMIPQDATRLPVVMLHGMALTGKSWETTPDGRMGWDEYFVRRGHPVYVPDQVARGRSGFDQAVFNNVRAGVAPPSAQPPLLRFSDENTWPNFRLGSAPGVPYPDTQFPVAAVAELSKQGVPDPSGTLPTPNPNYKALADLASGLGRAVLISHSQSGSFPLEAALIDTAGIAAMVLIEPGGCPARATDRQIATLATRPILIVYGDHLDDVPTGIPNFSWQTAYEGCRAFVARVNAAGGRARLLSLPELGIAGNSHMIMQDRNNLQVADLVLQWIAEHSGSE